MALVRKTDKLKTEIGDRLTTMQKEKLAPLLKTAIPMMGEIFFHYYNSKLFPITDDDYEKMQHLYSVHKGFFGRPDTLRFGFITGNDVNNATNVIKNTNRYGSSDFVSEELKYQGLLGQLDTSKFNRKQILFPANFGAEFGVCIDGVCIRFDDGYNGKFSAVISFLQNNDLEMQQAMQDTLGTTVFNRNDLLEVVPDEELLDKFETLRENIGEEFNAVEQVREYIFKTLWPGVSSLNGMVKYYPGITEFIDDETHDRLYKKTGRSPSMVPDHLAPPQEVLVTTAKTKMLKDK